MGIPDIELKLCHDILFTLTGLVLIVARKIQVFEQFHRCKTSIYYFLNLKDRKFSKEEQKLKIWPTVEGDDDGDGAFFIERV